MVCAVPTDVLTVPLCVELLNLYGQNYQEQFLQTAPVKAFLPRASVHRILSQNLQALVFPFEAMSGLMQQQHFNIRTSFSHKTSTEGQSWFVSCPDESFTLSLSPAPEQWCPGHLQATLSFSDDTKIVGSSPGAEASCTPCAERSTDTGQAPLDLLLWHLLNFSISCCRETLCKKWLRNTQRKFTSTETSSHHLSLARETDARGCDTGRDQAATDTETGTPSQ